jgi:hypothetical protein
MTSPTTPTIDFQDLCLRAVTICTETVGGEGVPYWMQTNEADPFFVARVTNITFGVDEGDFEEVETLECDLIVRHTVGNRTEGTPGEVEARLYAQLQQVIAALQSRTQLQSETYPEAPADLQSAYLQSVSGLQVFDSKSIGGTGDQIGTDYTVHCICRVLNFQEFE